MKKKKSPATGLYLNPSFLTLAERDETINWLKTITPLWENRFSKHNPPPAGDEDRQLLRPVYWLGGWQFACLNYYHPPKGTNFRCLRAEPLPAILSKLVARMEAKARVLFRGKDLPENWHLNTCLINFYGDRFTGDKSQDGARVGEHKDFEPGPVASLSLGERALFQFLEGGQTKNVVVAQQWLSDGSLQIFGGDKWKKRFFHRVQRVERKKDYIFPFDIENFQARRINFTFRYVPQEHIQEFAQFPQHLREDIKPYLQKLSLHSAYFSELNEIKLENCHKSQSQ